MTGATLPRARAAAGPLTACPGRGRRGAGPGGAALAARAGRAIGRVRAAASASDALLALDTEPVDVVFCDIKMPGLGGLDLARVLGRFAQPPLVVFVTAYDEHAGDAFDLRRHGLRAQAGARPSGSPRRCAGWPRRSATDRSRAAEPEDETIAVELGGVTRFVQRSQVRYVEAQGDYARLHTRPAAIWCASRSPRSRTVGGRGFVRIHRSTLVSLQHVDEIRIDARPLLGALGGPGAAGEPAAHARAAGQAGPAASLSAR